MKYLIYLLCMAISGFLFSKAEGQEAEAFNNIYTKAYLEIAPKDMGRALKIADSLYQISQSPLFQAKSLMLSASLYQQQQRLTKATELAEKAYTIISTTEDYNWMVRISGFLATQYRILQLYGKSRLYCNRALAMVPRIANPEMVKSTTGLINQELAYYEMEVKNYPGSIKHIRESQANFNHITQNKEYLTANNEQLLGLNYYYLANYDKSLHHYRNSLNLMAQMPGNVIKGLSYNGIAAVLIQKGDLKESKKYLDSASKIASESQHLSLKDEIYKTSQAYYLKTKDINNFAKIQKKQDSVREQITSRSTLFLDSSFIRLEKKNQEAERLVRTRDIPLAVGALVIVLGVFSFYVYRKKQKRRFEKFMAAFEAKKISLPVNIEKEKPAATLLDSTPADFIPDNPEEDPENTGQQPSSKDKVPLIPEETLQRLLDGLKQFENQHLFTSGSVSLSFLSTHLNTNSKYLSYILKQYKQKDFTSYINDLRINYIIQNLKTNAEWRKYKISVLAEKGGFSSHSKFTTVFKANTGLSPSVFVQYLDEETRGGVRQKDAIRADSND